MPVVKYVDWNNGIDVFVNRDRTAVSRSYHSMATTYNIGDYVAGGSGETLGLYQSLANSNLAHDVSDPAWWATIANGTKEKPFQSMNSIFGRVEEVRIAKSTASSLLGTLSWVSGSSLVTANFALPATVTITALIHQEAVAVPGSVTSLPYDIVKVDTAASLSTIMLGCEYYGTSGFKETYLLGCCTTSGATSTSVYAQVVQSISSICTISGGWNLSTEQRDGVTWFAHGALSTINRYNRGLGSAAGFLWIQNLGLARYYYGSYTGNYWKFQSMSAVGCITGFYMNGANCLVRDSVVMCRLAGVVGGMVAGDVVNSIWAIAPKANGYGIQASAPSMSVTGCTIVSCANNTSIGIYINASKVNVEGCITEGLYTGLQLDSNSTQCYIASCTVASAAVPLNLHGTESIITNSYLHSSSGNYVVYLSGGSNNTVRSSVLKGGSSYTIYGSGALRCRVECCTLLNSVTTAYIYPQRYTPAAAVRLSNTPTIGDMMWVYEYGTSMKTATGARSGQGYCWKFSPAESGSIVPGAGTDGSLVVWQNGGADLTLRIWAARTSTFYGTINLQPIYLGAPILTPTAIGRNSLSTEYSLLEYLVPAASIPLPGLVELRVVTTGNAGSVYLDSFMEST